MNKVIFIAGGAGYTGSAIARQLSEEGMQVILADIEYQRSKYLAKTIPNAWAVPLNAMDMESCCYCVDQVLKKYRRIDALVHTISKRTWGKFKTMPPGAWKDVFLTNLISFTNTTRALVPHFKQCNQGDIIHINSVVGKKGRAGESACSAAMAGCRGFIRGMAAELSVSNVRVNGICVADFPESQSFQRAMEISEEGFEAKVQKAVSPYIHRACNTCDVAHFVEFLLDESKSGAFTSQCFNLTGGMMDY